MAVKVQDLVKSLVIQIELGNIRVKCNAKKEDNGYWSLRGKVDLRRTLAISSTAVQITYLVKMVDDEKEYPIPLKPIQGRRTIRVNGHFTVRPGVELVVGRFSNVSIEHNPATATDWIIVNFMARVTSAYEELVTEETEIISDEEIFVVIGDNGTKAKQNGSKSKRKAVYVGHSSDSDDDEMF